MFLSAIKLKIFRKLFRLRNRHNLVSMVNMCDISHVQVGRKSYGAISVIDFSPADESWLSGITVRLPAERLFFWVASIILTRFPRIRSWVAVPINLCYTKKCGHSQRSFKLWRYDHRYKDLQTLVKNRFVLRNFLKNASQVPKCF